MIGQKKINNIAYGEISGFRATSKIDNQINTCPKVYAPASPRKIFQNGKLNTYNPKIEHINKILILRITVSPTACAKKARPPAISIHTPIANPFSPSIRFVAGATPPEINTVNAVAPRRVDVIQFK